MSTLRGLIRLIKASSGTDGVATNSFRYNVTAAANGVGMADYKINSPSWSNTPLGPGSYTYPNDTNITNITLTLGEFASNAVYIQSTDASQWSIGYIGEGTQQATINSVSWASNVATVSINLKGALTAGLSGVNVSVPWYPGYSYASSTVPYGDGYCYSGGPCNCSPDCCTYYNVLFSMDAYGPAASGYSDNDLSLTYVPDDYNAAFNPTIYGPGPTFVSTWPVRQNRRAGAVPTVSYVEWHDSAYGAGYYDPSPIITTSFYYSSNGDSQVGYYMRYKLDADVSWTNYGLVSWQDPRPDGC